MIRKFLPYVLIFLCVWYLPEIYFFLRGVSTDIYNEVSPKSSVRVEVKVVKKVSFLPEKFSLLTTGTPDLWVELFDRKIRTAYGGLTDEYGNVAIEHVPPGTYSLRVATKPRYSEAVITEAVGQKASVLNNASLLTTSIDEVILTKDIYLVPVLREDI